MHSLSTTFLALYLAHLSADFVLQSDRMVIQKRKGGWAEYASMAQFTARWRSWQSDLQI